MENALALIRARRSVRSFAPGPLAPGLPARLEELVRDVPNPFGIPVRFYLLNAREHALKSPVVSGAEWYAAASVPRCPHAEEAFGYSFQHFLLCAQSLGLGGVWLGGTMDRPAFEKAIALREDEMMPCVSPLGVPAAKMSLVESLMRKGIKADSRAPFESLFFEGDFSRPLTPAAAGPLAAPLEAIRLGPSAVNKQPWRVVVTPGAAHFYLRHAPGFGGGAAGNMQKVDLGIALCHFALAAREQGLALTFSTEPPALPAPEHTEYIATWRF